MTLSSAEKLAHTTIRIECDTEDEKVSVGTGFFFDLAHHGDMKLPLLITNKHVVEDSTIGRLYLTQKDDDGGPAIGDIVELELDEFKGRWIDHPDDEVDLCALPVGLLHTHANTESNRAIS